MRRDPSDPVIVEQTDAVSSRSVSVVISTLNRPALLRRCLEGVTTQVPPPLEIVVVDNTRGDEPTRAVALQAGARYIVEPVTGVSRARNRGLQTARGDIVAFLDDDAVPDPTWLHALVDAFGNARVAAVSGRILALDRVGPEGDAIFGGSDRIVLNDMSSHWLERATFGGIVQGSNLAIRRDVLSNWRGFDERLGAGTAVGGMEEHHAFFSLIDLGYSVVYTPTAVARHPALLNSRVSEARQKRNLRAASFCLTMLLVEEPRHRRRLATYAFQALRRTPREWRAQMALQEGTVPRWQRVGAEISGIGLYVRSRFSR